MVEVAESIIGSKIVEITPSTTKKVLTGKATVSTNDTLLLSDFTSIDAITVLKLSSGAAYTTSISTTSPTVTITQAGVTSQLVVFMAIGD